MGELKSLNINGRVLQYNIHLDDGYYEDHYYTMFYEGTEEITRKKYWLFGEKITKVKPKFVFYLNFNIESDHYTKSEVRSRIERKIELLGRLEEIQEGKLI